MPAPRKDHDPFARPLGCNGRYGSSGTRAHKRRNEPPCPACSESNGHYTFERKRGGLPKRKLSPCGTPAAAVRHRRKNEPLCFACRVADANDRAARRRAAA